MRLKHLFSPTKIGAMELRNRIVLPALGAGMAENSIPSDTMIGYYAARAKGGVGLIIVEMTAVHPSVRYPIVAALDDDSLIPRLDVNQPTDITQL